MKTLFDKNKKYKMVQIFIHGVSNIKTTKEKPSDYDIETNENFLGNEDVNKFIGCDKNDYYYTTEKSKFVEVQTGGRYIENFYAWLDEKEISLPLKLWKMLKIIRDNSVVIGKDTCKRVNKLMSDNEYNVLCKSKNYDVLKKYKWEEADNYAIQYYRNLKKAFCIGSQNGCVRVVY